jgi:hypothetical protein
MFVQNINLKELESSEKWSPLGWKIYHVIRKRDLCKWSDGKQLRWGKSLLFVYLNGTTVLKSFEVSPIKTLLVFSSGTIVLNLFEISPIKNPTNVASSTQKPKIFKILTTLALKERSISQHPV